jgi:serine/threonine-protein kinase
MLVRRGDDPDFVKVLDFGIARLDWGEESLATQAGLIFGTARYISPEGSQGEPVGPEADVYAIATILYQCLAGQTPFDADSPMALLMMHAYEPPPPLLSVPRASYVPSPLSAAIMRNLAKSPDDRASDARTFGRELVEAARQGGLSPDDLVPRSTLLGQRAAHASFVSIQRTKQMQLSPETAALIGATAASTLPSLGPASLSSPLPGSLPPHGTELSSGELPPTLSDEPGPRSTASSTPALSTPSPRSSQPLATSTPLGAPETTLDDDDGAAGAIERRGKARLVLFVVACFLGGAGIAAAGAHQLGFLGAPSGSRAGYVERAEHALRNRHWTTPPNDNVKDITDEGLARTPGDAALIDVRQRAAEELVTAALGRKYAGDLAGALEFAALARELSPNNTTAQHLAAELERLVADTSALVTPAPDNDAGAARTQPSRAAPHRLAPSSSAAPSAPVPPGPAPSESVPPPVATGSAVTPPGPNATGGRWL